MVLAAFALASTAASAGTIDARVRSQLQKLTPDERLEQRCDIEAMDRIGAAKNGFRPDKVIAYAFGDPKLAGTTLKTRGAVFRSRGEWYRLSYRCEASADRLAVKAFKYRIGGKVPRADWAAHYLYD
ncbi:DUF930 domain-containing protein [Shinella pollutisoli]|uniref:DUF930 domain-containing protein n=1 Tax=Shinella pollutisoli TaxID=2250594 RepID=A0ABV7DLI7_9HYPH|nr:DUF930 domain-containing protein [Shinella pollutisoli]